jgi:hypothetical protein
MKRKIYIYSAARILLLSIIIIGFTNTSFAQNDSAAVSEASAKVKKVKLKPVKNTFPSIWIIDNQTVIVPVRKTFEMDIMHRFGTVDKGYEDFFGVFAPSNIRLGFNYVPINNLMIGASVTKTNYTWELYGKYALIKQTKGKYPVSVTYYANAAVDTRGKDNFLYWSDRLMYFNQLLIARKINERISVQVAPSVTHQNIVNGYFVSEKTGSTGADSVKSVLAGEMKHEHVAVALSGRYKIKNAMAAVVNIDQPITKHLTGNPKPNISFGIELTTSSHAFQFFFGNYPYITPQRNNLFNKNDYKARQFLIGFNITKIWNY